MDQKQKMLRIVMSEQKRKREKKTLKTNQTPTLPLRKKKNPVGASKVNEKKTKKIHFNTNFNRKVKPSKHQLIVL